MKLRCCRTERRYCGGFDWSNSEVARLQILVPGEPLNIWRTATVICLTARPPLGV